jgi:hypothetical protein
MALCAQRELAGWFKGKELPDQFKSLVGRAVAQVFSRRSLTAESRVQARVNPYGICGGQVSLRVLQFSLSVSFHRGSPYSYVIWGMNSKPDGNRSSETVSPRRHEQDEQILQ